LDEYLDPDTFIESNEPEIVSLATELGEGMTTACEQSRAFYDYVGDSMSYIGYNPDDMGALISCQTLEGDCTDFADFLIALNRAAGIPARFLEGVTCCTAGDQYVPGDVKHDWLEVYLPSSGWVQMDPTWGRGEADRDTYFAGMTPDHIIITQGRNLSVLGNYHYWYYTYRPGSAQINAEEFFSIVEVEE
jgi:transglutaminase-like putative cysteine protease